MFFKKKEDIKQKTNEEPKNETFAGEVIKCPACHEIVSSLMLECPACHTELHHKPNPAVLEFSKQISKFENSNAIKNKARSILHIESSNVSNDFSLSDMKEVNYINEFTVPINQASFYEFMIYIKTKMEYLLNNYKGNSYKWSKVWLNKAKEIKEKSCLVLPNDEFIGNKYIEITNTHKKITRKFVLRILLLCLLLLAPIAIAIIMLVLENQGII